MATPFQPPYAPRSVTPPYSYNAAALSIIFAVLPVAVWVLPFFIRALATDAYWSFFLIVLTFGSPLAVIFGVIHVRRDPRMKHRGRWLALVGLSLGILQLPVAMFIAFIFVVFWHSWWPW